MFFWPTRGESSLFLCAERVLQEDDTITYLACSADYKKCWDILTNEIEIKRAGYHSVQLIKKVYLSISNLTGKKLVDAIETPALISRILKYAPKLTETQIVTRLLPIIQKECRSYAAFNHILNKAAQGVIYENSISINRTLTNIWEIFKSNQAINLRIAKFLPPSGLECFTLDDKLSINENIEPLNDLEYETPIKKQKI